MELISKTFDELTTTELYEILKARTAVFLMEQNIRCLDTDDMDYKSLHCFFMQDKKVTAYLRAFYDDNDKNVVIIGRVLTLEHGKGMGKELMQQSINAIKEKMKCKKIKMDAQTHAVGFYEKFGFKAVSEDFLEEGVLHRVMELELQ